MYDRRQLSCLLPKHSPPLKITWALLNNLGGHSLATLDWSKEFPTTVVTYGTNQLMETPRATLQSVRLLDRVASGIAWLCANVLRARIEFRQALPMHRSEGEPNAGVALDLIRQAGVTLGGVMDNREYFKQSWPPGDPMRGTRRATCLCSAEAG